MAEYSLNESHLFSQVRQPRQQPKPGRHQPLNESHLFSQVRLPLKNPKNILGFQEATRARGLNY